jgi:NTP pyrophosphatase (non-canonical NTP hydrolase)
VSVPVLVLVLVGCILAPVGAVMLVLPRRRSRAARMLAEFHTHRNADERTNGPTLRATLHREEHKELQDELDAPTYHRAQIARELADVVYVAYGTAWVFEIDLDLALTEVHRAAMTKLDANVKREDGKIVKPPGFVPPDMSEAIS